MLHGFMFVLGSGFVLCKAEVKNQFFITSTKLKDD